VARANDEDQPFFSMRIILSLCVVALLLVAEATADSNSTLTKRQRKSNKCGACATNTINVGALTSGGAISWYYTWSVWRDGRAGSAKFVPMVWGAKSINDLNNALNQGVFNGVDAVLGFNEPERSDQANLSPQAAADLWRNHMEPLRSRGIRLGAPVVSSAPAGKVWLLQFFSACGGCNIDFVPLHWYGGSGQNFINYVTDMHNTFRRNVWVTEWACVNYGDGPCDQQSVYGFMGWTTQWLDSTPWVERFSWFGVRVNGIPGEDALLDASGNNRTPLGNQYAVNGGHG